jgi:hypothetical protein
VNQVFQYFVNLSGLDEAVVNKLKQDLRKSKFYIYDPFLAELNNKLADIASLGDNVIVVMNKYATFEGISCGYGVYCPKGKSIEDCASGRVMLILDARLTPCLRLMDQAHCV